MAERFRPADSETVKAAVSTMEMSVRDLDDLVKQLKTYVIGRKRVGHAPEVGVFKAVQEIGRERMGPFQNALDSLTEAVIGNPGLVAPVLGSEAQAGIMGGGHA